jgi:SAM-dependent methyltransferase
VEITVAQARASMNTALTGVQRRLDAELAGRHRLQVLDIGCGSELRVRIPEHAWVTGVDEDETALSRNPQLDEVVVTDLASWEPPREHFDLVVSWWVLEHLSDPRAALSRLAGAVRPGGLVLLAVPNLRTPKSLIAKVTPHRFHVWLFRRVLRRPHAGTPGYAPYPTTLRMEISPRRLLAEVTRLGLRVVHLDWFEDPKQRCTSVKFRCPIGRARCAVSETQAADGMVVGHDPRGRGTRRAVWGERCSILTPGSSRP